MKVFLLPLAAIIALSAQAQAETYHRFWRGNKSAGLSWTGFSSALNTVFLPATVKTGAGNGMIAYQPALLEGFQGLPHEIALVSYADKTAYDALYATEQGKAYQKLHWDYFDPISSRSLVPRPFAGEIRIEEAYDFNPGYSDWMKNSTTVLVFHRRPGEREPVFIERAKERLNRAFKEDSRAAILDRVVLAARDYWIEYVSAPGPLENTAGADLAITMRSAGLKTARLTSLGGLNFRF